MTWLKLDDGFDEHQKLNNCADYDRALSTMVQLMCYAARNLTDGTIPPRVVARMDRDTIKELLRVGLLDADGSGITIHDYLNYNPTREQVLKERERWRGYKRSSNTDSNVDSTVETRRNHTPPVPVPQAPTKTQKEEVRNARDDDSEDEPKGFISELPCFDQLPASVYSDHPKDATANAILLREWEARFGMPSQYDLSELRKMVLDGCVPDCPKTPKQCDECLLLAVSVVRDKLERAPATKRVNWKLGHHIMRNDRREAS